MVQRHGDAGITGQGCVYPCLHQAERERTEPGATGKGSMPGKAGINFLTLLESGGAALDASELSCLEAGIDGIEQADKDRFIERVHSFRTTRSVSNF